MRKAKQDVDEYFADVPYFVSDDDVELGGGEHLRARDPADKRRPARQRVELRNEQRSLREQLSDWEDYGDEFDLDH